MVRVIASKQKKNSLMDKMTLLSKIRKALINDKIAKKICKEKGVGEWFLKGVPIDFGEIKPSAKTVDSSIILNNKLMDKPFNIMMRYVIHELTHSIQHVQDQESKRDTEEYLDRPTEIEAFKNQIEYDADKRGEDKAEEYVDGLLDFHDIKGKERKDKKDELLEDLD